MSSDNQARVVLTINRFDSRCGACGKSCDPFEEVHERRCGYDQHEGCGARYTHVTSDYPDLWQRVGDTRPDLILVDRMVVGGGLDG